jgi:hypothetical protein
MDADDLRRLSDGELRRVQERLLALVPDATHPELLSYQQATAEEKLGVKYERVAALVSQGVLIAEKLPRDAHKWIGSDQIAWYRLKQRGMDEGLPNPALVRQEATRRVELRQRTAPTAQLVESTPTVILGLLGVVLALHLVGKELLTKIGAYLGELTDNSDTILPELARNIAGALTRDALGLEPLPAEERALLVAVLDSLTKRGDDARS